MKTIREIFKESFETFEDDAFVIALQKHGFSEEVAEQIINELYNAHNYHIDEFGGDFFFWEELEHQFDWIEKEYKVM